MTSYAPLLDKPEDKEGVRVYLTPVDALKLVKREKDGVELVIEVSRFGNCLFFG